jgi:hypothetical protein
MPAAQAAHCADAALDGIAVQGHASPYDAWRDRVRELVSGARSPAPPLAAPSPELVAPAGGGGA